MQAACPPRIASSGWMLAPRQRPAPTVLPRSDGHLSHLPAPGLPWTEGAAPRHGFPATAPRPAFPSEPNRPLTGPRCVLLPPSLRTQRPSLPLHQPENPGPRASGHLKPSLVISLCDALRTVSATNLTKITFLALNFLDFERVLYWWTLRPIWRDRSPEWQRR